MALGIKSATEPLKVTDIVYQMVQAELPPATLLPLLPVHLDALKEAWEHPSAVNPSSRRHYAMYKVDRSSVPFLFSHPPPNSMIVHSSAKSKGFRSSVLPDHDHRKADAFARKNYSVAVMLAWIYTYLPYMSAYVLSMFNKISDLSQDQAPSTAASSSSVLSQILPVATEVFLVSKQQICTLRHAVSYISCSSSFPLLNSVMPCWPPLPCNRILS